MGDKKEVKSTVVDNSRLEEMMKGEMTPEAKEEFLEILKKSWLYLPVLFRKRRFEDDEITGEFDLSGQFGFDVGHLHETDGDTLALFTGLEIMDQTGLESSTVLISMENLAEILRQAGKYSAVSINIFCENNFTIPTDEFLDLFAVVADCRIGDIRNNELCEFLNKNEFSDDEFNDFKAKISSSTFITAWVDEEEGANYVPAFDRNNSEYFQLFTNLGEFEKVFEYDIEEVYPQAFGFCRIVEFTECDFVINPASQSFVLKRDMFKAQ